MTGVLKQKARVARVRRLQHGLAASSAAAAAGQLKSLQVSDERLARMRRDLVPEEGATSGARLASAGELAMRLDAARIGLSGNIDNARSVAAAREAARMQARREQESADKLEQAASRAAAEILENRLNRARPRRPRRGTEQW
jgi:uncharacterized SAM-binding protein YcdF (DUF218 family)